MLLLVRLNSSNMLLAVALTLAAMPLLAAEFAVLTPVVLIGGGRDDPGIYSEAVSLAGGSRAKVAIVAIASSRPAVSGQAYEEFLGSLGVVGHYVAIPDRQAASSRSVLKSLAEADLLFFTGGDQSRLVERLSGTPALGALLDGWVRGAVVVGTSAGAMPWGSMYIANGSSLGSLGLAFDKDPQGRRGLDLRAGLRVLEDLIVDTHLDSRGRLGRLLLALGKTTAAVGIGADEQSAAILTGTTVRAVGQNAVTIIEASRLLGNNASHASSRVPFAAGPFVMHRLKGGQSTIFGHSTPSSIPPAGSPEPRFFFGILAPATQTPSTTQSAGPLQPITLIAAPAPGPVLASVGAFVRDSGGTQARLLIIAGNGAARDAETWRGHLLRQGAGRASVLTASEIHDQNLSQSLERATGLFFLEDAAGSLVDVCNQENRRLRDVIAIYATRLPSAGAGIASRALGEVAYFGSPSQSTRQVKQGLGLVAGTVAEEQFWEGGGLERLIQATLLANRGLGIGLGPENSVRIAQGQVAVIGRGQAFFLDARAVNSFTVPQEGSIGPSSGLGFEVSILPPSGAYDLVGRRPRF